MSEGSRLPSSWLAVSLSDCLELNQSGVWGDEPREGDAGYPVLRSTNIQNGHLVLDDIANRSVNDAIVPKYALADGDILITKSSGSPQLIGKNAVFKQPTDGRTYLFSNFTQRLRVKRDSLDSDYLFFYLNSMYAQAFLTQIQSTTTGLRNLDMKLYASQKIPLPPLPEQRRIAEILRQADDLRRMRRQANDKARALLPSLFNEMFGSLNSLSAPEQFGPLHKVADVVQGVAKGRKFGDQKTVIVPYLRVANVQAGYLDLSEIKAIEVLPEDVDKYRLQRGDVLVTEGGDFDKLGRGAIWESDIADCIHQNHIFRIRPDRDALLPEFLDGLLQTEYARAYFFRAAKKTTNLASINLTQLRNFPIPRVDSHEQQKFVDARREFRQVSAQLDQASELTDTLFQSLLAQAFSGELTSAWRAAHPSDSSLGAAYVSVATDRRVLEPEISIDELLGVGPRKFIIEPAQSQPALSSSTVSAGLSTSLPFVEAQPSQASLHGLILDFAGQLKRRYWTLTDLIEHPTFKNLPRNAVRETVDMLIVLGQVRKAYLRNEGADDPALATIEAYTLVRDEELVDAKEIQL